MKRTLLLVLLMLTTMPTLMMAGDKSPNPKRFTYTVQKIWDGGMYEAFTSIEKYKGWYYVAFREGEGHVFDENGKAEGKIRVIRSRDLRKWKSVALLGQPDRDFRDPKLSITPDGQLLVSIGVSTYVDRKEVAQGLWAAFSTDGLHYDLRRCSLEGAHTNDWPWHLTWNGDTGYNPDYWWDGERGGLSLLQTKDGQHYTPVCELEVPGSPNEASIRFTADQKMTMVVRRGGGNGNGYWGISEPPYTQWDWKEIPLVLGGPDFLFLEGEDKVVLCSRCHHIGNWCTTSIYVGNADGTNFHQVLVLPSGGDTSYPGLLIENGELIVSYYASHEANWRPSIYLARIPLDCLW